VSRLASSAKKVYLDTNILAYWAYSYLVKEADPMRERSKRAESCKKLLDMYRAGQLDVVLQTSEWALSELAQAFFDRAVWTKFPFEGFEMREFGKLRRGLQLPVKEREAMLAIARSFEGFLHRLDVEMIPVRLDYALIHDLVYRYALETGDAVHVLAASAVSDYIVTVDSGFIEANVSEIEVVNPGNLITIKGLRSRKGR
jgi:predicted nucleic acid-binding protein